jgi:hypothetical protein
MTASSIARHFLRAGVFIFPRGIKNLNPPHVSDTRTNRANAQRLIFSERRRRPSLAPSCLGQATTPLVNPARPSRSPIKQRKVRLVSQPSGLFWYRKNSDTLRVLNASGARPLLTAAPARSHVRSAPERSALPETRGLARAASNPPFYPLNYGNSDICDFRFSPANCKPRTSVVCAEIALVSSYTGNYTAIQRLIQRQDAICREVLERASAAAFTQFVRQIRRFDQRIQASRSRGYIAERI